MGIKLLHCPNSEDHNPMLVRNNGRYICFCPVCSKFTFQAMKANRFMGGYGTEDAAVNAWNDPNVSLPA